MRAGSAGAKVLFAWLSFSRLFFKGGEEGPSVIGASAIAIPSTFSPPVSPQTNPLSHVVRLLPRNRPLFPRLRRRFSVSHCDTFEPAGLVVPGRKTNPEKAGSVLFRSSARPFIRPRIGAFVYFCKSIGTYAKKKGAAIPPILSATMSCCVVALHGLWGERHTQLVYLRCSCCASQIRRSCIAMFKAKADAGSWKTCAERRRVMSQRPRMGRV